jgi:predicted DNA-binding transcriptional regulator AlpA
VEQVPIMAKKTTAELNGPLWPARDVLTRYGISDMTLWRWLKDSKLGFPRPVVINRRRYFYEAELIAWERARVSRRAVV